MPASMIVIVIVAAVGYVGIYLSSLALENGTVPNGIIPAPWMWELYADLVLVLTGALYALWFERAYRYVKQSGSS